MSEEEWLVLFLHRRRVLAPVLAPVLVLVRSTFVFVGSLDVCLYVCSSLGLQVMVRPAGPDPQRFSILTLIPSDLLWVVS